MEGTVSIRADGILGVRPLGFPWETVDPFLFCAYHDDDFPAGNERMGPAASLAGRAIGQDFEKRDGWRMYHGSVVPGFPQHPHRGFETVTVMRQGYIDHSDSLGATARFGPGDVQWLTAGKGIVHSEMFPLLDRNRRNPVELFQIWLNLPRADKFVEPHFSMLWDRDVPRVIHQDDQGRKTEVIVVSGRLGDAKAPPPPPHSWASRSDTHVAIWTMDMAPDARWRLEAAQPGLTRMLYFYKGNALTMNGLAIPPGSAVQLRSDAAVDLVNGNGTTCLLLLEGRPIGEPVVQYGPFVMTSRAEIQQTFADYQNTGFGGWPWPTDDPVLPRDEGRHARHADGRVERVA
ncbi:MAG TPA: pirin family protein [Terriglobia bacterium]|nr:pirin family protein [Terriglobia bacterium]